MEHMVTRSSTRW